MLTAMIVNRRPEAEFLFIAPTMEIAAIAYKQAKGTIRLDPELTQIFPRAGSHQEDHPSALGCHAADQGGRHRRDHRVKGDRDDDRRNPSVARKKANAAEVFIELRGALTKRPDGFLFQTTTQSKATPSGVFASELAMARSVRDGKCSMPLLPGAVRASRSVGARRRLAGPAVLADRQSESGAIDQRGLPRARGAAGRCRRAGGGRPDCIAAFQRPGRDEPACRWLGRRELLVPRRRGGAIA